MTDEQIHRIKKLKTQMRRVNRFFHFTRNNSKNRFRFYNGFIAVFGYDTYKNDVYADVRNAWDSAQNSFDKMFGLLLAWAKTENPGRLFDKFDKEKQVEDKSQTQEKLTDEENSKYEREIAEIRRKTEILKAEYELKRIEFDIQNLTEDHDASEDKHINLAVTSVVTTQIKKLQREEL